jgi:formate dehydrogenase maturation protein FdhE
VSAVAAVTNDYERRRCRARELSERWPFAAEVLQFYARLLDVQEAAHDEALGMEPAAAVAFAAERIVPRIVEVSATDGPSVLQRGVLERFDTMDFGAAIRAWLQGDPLGSVDRFLARAATAPLLAALGSRAEEVCTGPRDDLHCPTCGGLPQFAYVAEGDENLVTPHRFLECSRCTRSWAFARITCAGCGEDDSEKLLHFSEIGALEAESSGRTVRGADPDAGPRPDVVAEKQPVLPHVSIDGCTTCSHYVLSIDLRRDPRAVPVVDELAALPLYLYASERGLSKIVPNQLGF